jgi:hypothetical protein
MANPQPARPDIDVVENHSIEHMNLQTRLPKACVFPPETMLVDVHEDRFNAGVARNAFPVVLPRCSNEPTLWRSKPQGWLSPDEDAKMGSG